MASMRTIVDVCVSRNCTYADQLEARGLQSRICDSPVRDRSHVVNQLAWAMFGIATFFFLGRVVSRITTFGGAGFYWDDCACVSCYVPLVGIAVLLQLAVNNGLGQDDYRIGVANVNEFLKEFYAAELLYNYVIIFTKISIILLYIRTWWDSSRDNHRPFRVVCWCLVAVLVATVTAVGFAEIFQCTPVSYTWNQVLPGQEREGTCISRRSIFYAFGALNICYDVIVLFLPVPLLLTLQIPVIKRIGVSSVFLVGFAVTVCSIGRLNYLAMLQDTNVTWNHTDLALWTLVEVDLSMICCCMPGIAGLVQRYWKYLPSSAKYNSQSCLGRSDSFSSASALDITASEMLEEGRGPRKSVIEVPNAGIDDLPCSPVLQVGVGETLVNIQHSIPNDTTRDKFVYKDAHGIVHEVEVVDRPVVPVRNLDGIATGSSGSDTAVKSGKSLEGKASSGSGDSDDLTPTARPSSRLSNASCAMDWGDRTFKAAAMLHEMAGLTPTSQTAMSRSELLRVVHLMPQAISNAGEPSEYFQYHGRETKPPVAENSTR
ncbi:uncharacterized protein MYCFIDRAFT_80561 [Pseudocercospora fijiensis CIRAD86]|uniref:Rhodopsin domain-containing protein n=1 Tax=Pseudocercospora fijiensis (strain CIRAD86) TaxID=383855 RepID=M3B0Q8_PSEFD|nr:uncharacterized protein MYCFIDRAFT_80561 [Pseudocercospora fijiensis CIRAD86]EME82988.1 hypothetical protein MYCFIDRAFT_80561 [Pseudocercospora fijiensis CIRAD86]